MSEKEDLKAKAEELGLSTLGTSAELKKRIALHSVQSAGEGEPLVAVDNPDGPAGTEPETPEPEVSEDTQPSRPPIGAFVQTENFNLNITEHGGGAPLLNVSRKGWVGPAQLVTHADLLDELIEGLTELSQQD